MSICPSSPLENEKYTKTVKLRQMDEEFATRDNKRPLSHEANDGEFNVIPRTRTSNICCSYEL